MQVIPQKIWESPEQYEDRETDTAALRSRVRLHKMTIGYDATMETVPFPYSANDLAIYMKDYCDTLKV